MNTTLTIDKAGRVVIPKELRDSMNLSAGDELTLESTGDRLTLQPVRSLSPLHKERGIWVYHGGGTLEAKTTDSALQQLRQQRDHTHRHPRA